MCKWIFSILLIVQSFSLYSQCGPGTPAFIVDLSDDANAVWQSPSVERADNCCETSFPIKCVKFTITLHPDAEGINFSIIDGALPGGALFYQINCGPETPVGEPICLSGPGPHILTFCKPGKNENIYQIESIPPAIGGTSVVINDGCTGSVSATGFNPSTVVWRSVYPGADGDYDNYLSCSSGCLEPTVTAVGPAPAYIDYEVCGQPVAICSFPTICDTVRVTFNPTLFVNILPLEPAICFGQTSTNITATGVGGTPPYTYLWNNINPSQSIDVGLGTFTVELSDASDCPPTYNSVTVISFSVAISADAGPDQSVCSQNNPVVTLNGAVTGATGGVWSGGSGTYSPDSTTLSSLFYTPTAAELAAGSLSLYLTTTGNATCPSDVDTVVFTFTTFDATVTTTVTNVSCFGGSDGTALANVAGGAGPFTYLWNTIPTDTSSLITGLTPNTYALTVTDNVGCTFDTSTVITQPLPLALNSIIQNVSCTGGSDGIVTVMPYGGTMPYTYNWSPGGQTGSSFSGLSAGTYTVIVSDSNNCQITSSYVVTEPQPLVATSVMGSVSCYGGSDGSINATVSGGTAPYSYSWNSGATSPNLSGAIAGTYTLTVTDNNACTINLIDTVVQPTALLVSVSTTNETCDYLDDGTATVTPSEGTPPYTYLWQGGQTTNSISNLSSGTYSVTVSDSASCPLVVFATITEPATLTVSFINQTNVQCFAGSDASITASATGGTLNYSYLWNPGATVAATNTGLTAGNYSVTVTDNNGCVTGDTVSITEPSLPLSASVTVTNVSCDGGSDGTSTVTPAGGTSPYTYLWSAGNQTTATASSLSAGTYTVIITDANNCQLAETAVVTQPLPISIVITPSDVSCFGGSDGSAASTVSGGTTPYSYVWSGGGATTSTASGLIAGTYTLSVTDALGCTASSSTLISEPQLLTVTATGTDKTCDYKDDGTATALPAGGTAAYSYLWEPGLQTTNTVSGLSLGTFSITITDALGCVVSTTVVIDEPLPILINFIEQSNVSCFGGNDAAVSSSVSGGTPNYSYVWSAGGATTNAVYSLSAGYVNLTVTDSESCIAQDSVLITEPSSPLSVSSSFTAVSCYGGSDGTVSAVAAGGTSAYQYTWMPGSYTGQNVSGLSAGNYTVTARDANGCTDTNSVEVTQGQEIVLTTSSVNSDCGQPNGQTSVVVSGGVSPYTYLWAPSGGTGATATGLVSGAYVVEVTDFLGCKASQYGNVNENSAPTVTIISTTNVSCYGGSDGSATLGLSGGIGPFTYNWLPSGGTDSIATGLPAGSYTAYVLAANGCRALATTSPAISEPPPIVVTVITTPVGCFGGSDGTAIVSALGGTVGYTYQWLPSGETTNSISGLSALTYTVEVTDLNSCIQLQDFGVDQPLAALTVNVSVDSVSCFNGGDGSVYATAVGGTTPFSYVWMPINLVGPTLSSLAIGTYTVTASDKNGCVDNNFVSIEQPNPIVLIPDSVNATCGFANGQASVLASGGTGAFSYNWSPSGGTNAVATGLLPATYSVTVVDANGCNQTIAIQVNDEPSPTVIVSSVTNVSCNGGADGTATASVSGGTSPFTYSWSPSGGTGLTATGLSVGTYTVMVTDDNGCQSNPAESAEITEPSAVSALVTTSNVNCFGGSTGTASINVAGGTPGYTYLWMHSGETTSSVSGLLANTYTVQVSDLNNCVLATVYTITEPQDLTTTIFPIKNVSCFQGNDGEATASVVGGSPFYTYSWFPTGGNGPIISNLTAGSHTVTVTDAKSCVTTAEVTITEPATALSASGTDGLTSCFGGADGSSTITPSGGTPNYSYQWSPSGQTSQTATGLSKQNYFVLITDNNGCQTNTSIAVYDPPIINGSLISVNASCGLANGTISSQIAGGTPPYSYLWNPGSETTTSVGNLLPGTYTLVVSDANGCSFSISETIIDIPGGVATLGTTVPVSCTGGNDGSGTVSISQGSPPYSLAWMPYGGNSLTATGLIAGSYTVTATDSLGCIATVIVPINEPSILELSLTSLTNVACNGEASGSINVTANGGTPAYSYFWPSLNESTPMVTNLGEGNYLVMVTDQNACIDSISIDITQPDVLLSSIANFQNPPCYGLKGSVAVIATGGTIPYNYFWSPDSTLIGRDENVLAGTFSITVTDAMGCQALSIATLIDPVIVSTISGPNDTVCVGQTATLSATATGGSGNFYFAWQPSNVINGGTINLMPIGDTSLIVVAYDENGCPGNPDTLFATTYSVLTPDNFNAVANSPICLGQSITLYVEQRGNTGPLTFDWNNNLGSGVGAFVLTPTEPTTYVVTATSALCGLSVDDSVEIDFVPQPTLSLLSDTNALCVPGILQFYDNSITGNLQDPITSWNWSFGDGTFSNQQNPTHEFASQGTYNVRLQVTTDAGCTSDNAAAPLEIQAYQYPIAAFSINSLVLTIPMEKLITKNQSVGADYYNWDFGDGGNSTIFSPEYEYTTVGIYDIQLIATSQYNCSDTVYSKVKTTSDFIFPNAFTPSTDGPNGGRYVLGGMTNDVFFPYTAGIVEYKLEVFNRWGELIFESEDVEIGWDGYYRGQLCQQDVYIWKAFLKLNNGDKYIRTGDVTLLR